MSHMRSARPLIVILCLAMVALLWLASRKEASDPATPLAQDAATVREPAPVVDGLPVPQHPDRQSTEPIVTLPPELRDIQSPPLSDGFDYWGRVIEGANEFPIACANVTGFSSTFRV